MLISGSPISYSEKHVLIFLASRVAFMVDRMHRL